MAEKIKWADRSKYIKETMKISEDLKKIWTKFCFFLNFGNEMNWAAPKRMIWVRLMHAVFCTICLEIPPRTSTNPHTPSPIQLLPYFLRNLKAKIEYKEK